MEINLNFDLLGNPEPLTIVLANRNGNKLGQLDVNTDSIDLSSKLKGASEFSFTINKYIDGEITNLWDKIVDFKLVYCVEWDMWFEAKVELDEATETTKTVFCTQLGQAELSQIMLYNIEINTEADIERDDYKISILYDKDNPKYSILHRFLEKAPHYSIRYVDPTIASIQRSFSVDGSSICDALDSIEEEIGCLVEYDSNSDENGKPSRTISVYDLQQNCNDCGHRGEFIDECPKCGSKNIKNGYGKDTLIFVTADELASNGIQLVADTDSVKNCFKLEGGDDLMTATIRNCNPNGTDYIWYFSDDIKEDMSDELVQKIDDYDKEYKDSYKAKVYNLDANLLSSYNVLVNKYKAYYDTQSTCLACDYEGNFDGKCPKCESENILKGKSLQTISTPITGYSALMNAYYNTIDLSLYLKSGLMPHVEMSDTSAKEQVKLLTSSSLSPVAVENIKTVSKTTANSAILSMAKILVKSTYKVEIKEPDKIGWINNSDGTKTWTGNFIVTNYSDETDTSETDMPISIIVNGDEETFIKQKVDKALNKENTDDYSVSGLFAKEYNEFCNELKKYALNPLKNFYEYCDACLTILTGQGAGNKEENSNLYDALYKPYYDKSTAIAAEIKIRENEVAIIEGVYDTTDENNEVLISEGLQINIENCKKQTQQTLDFEKYLGKELWLEFCLYRREDKYSNDNYISDGLNNSELFQRALEFVDVAENEIYKSSELQHSISTTLNNLLVIKKFQPLVKSFKNGNWIRVQIDDKVYKLRLLEYSLSYGDLNNISVEFSDLTKIKNSTTDVQDIVSQASSIASSYDTVKRQSNQGNIAQSTIEQWFENGLNAANTQIQNNNSEEIIITKNGLLGRSKDDITGTYSPEQFKLTHNIMAYTSDGWLTVNAALGKHKYNKWQNNQWVYNVEDYGLSAKFVTAGYVTGSQIIGGEIVSSNYELNKNGTYINLLEGSFDFAGGRMVYDGDKTLTLSNVKIDWSSTTKPEMTDISGLGEYKNKLDSLVFKQSTEIGETYVVSPNIVGGYIKGGYLDIVGANNSRVIIDPNNLTDTGYIFQVNNGTKVTVSVDKDGNSEFSGIIRASNFIGGSLLIGKENESDISYVEITEDGVLTANGAEIIGAITAKDGNIGGFEINGTSIFNGTDSLESTESGIYIGTDGIRLYGDTIDEEIGVVPCVDIVNGVLTADGAQILGHIDTKTGSIGGWNVDYEYINSLDGSVGLYSGDEENICPTSSSPIRFYAGNETPVDAPFYVAASGFVNAAKGNIAGWDIVDNKIYKTTLNGTEVGMSVGNASYQSLVTDSVISDVISKTVDLPSLSGNNVLQTKIITIDELLSDNNIIVNEEEKSKYKIYNWSINSINKTGGDEYYQTVTHTFEPNDFLVDIEGYYYAIVSQRVYGFDGIPPEYVRVELDDKTSDSFYISVEYLGDVSDGQNVRFNFVAGTSKPISNTTISARLIVSDEGINMYKPPSYTTNISEDQVEINISPQVSGSYQINTEYMLYLPKTSPIRFYAGKRLEDDYSPSAPISVDVAFDAGAIGETVSKTIEFGDIDIDMYDIDVGYDNSFTHTPENGEITQSFIVTTNTEMYTDSAVSYYGFQTIDNVLPSWLPTDSSSNGLSIYVDNDKMTVNYLGNGSVKASSYQNLKGTVVNGVATFDYNYNENLDIWHEIDNKGITIYFTPKTDRDYNIAVTYKLIPKIPSYMVLEDGSLYANNAQIYGDIYANNGVFNGEINAKGGTIGKLIIQDNGISSGSDGLTFESSGLIIAQQLEINDYFKANNLKIGTISGRNNSSAYLDFESAGYDTETVTATTEMVSKTEGSYNWLGNKVVDDGSVELKITTNINILNAKTFNIDVCYKDEDDGGFVSDYEHRTITVTLAGGSNSATVTVPELVLKQTRYSNHMCRYYSSSVVTKPYTQQSPRQISAIASSGSLVPTKTSLTLGTIDNSWDTIYANKIYTEVVYDKNGNIIAPDSPLISDANKKNTISSLQEKYSQLFDALHPVSFKLNDGTNGRTHMGLIAQELKTSMDSCGIDSQDFAAYCEWKDKDGNATCGIRYTEFISMCIYEIQKLKKRVAELENLNVEKQENKGEK